MLCKESIYNIVSQSFNFIFFISPPFTMLDKIAEYQHGTSNKKSLSP